MPDEVIDEVLPAWEHVWTCPACKAVMSEDAEICDYCDQ